VRQLGHLPEFLSFSLLKNYYPQQMNWLQHVHACLWKKKFR